MCVSRTRGRGLKGTTRVLGKVSLEGLAAHLRFWHREHKHDWLLFACPGGDVSGTIIFIVGDDKQHRQTLKDLSTRIDV